MLKKTAFAFVAMVLMLGLSTAAFAQKKVVRVVIVKTDNAAGYAQSIETGKEIMKKLGITSETHVYQATFAGPEAGTVVVTIEYSSLAALADADAKTHADKDYQAWIKSLAAIRTIVSDSIFREL